MKAKETMLMFFAYILQYCQEMMSVLRRAKYFLLLVVELINLIG